MTKRVTFVDAVAARDATPEDIDDWVTAWHEGAGVGLELHEYLGLSWLEYGAWVKQPSTLRQLLQQRGALPVERRSGRDRRSD